MSEDSPFYKILKKKFPDLLELIKKRNYIILEPKKAVHDIMLNKNFYSNHICYKNPFNESLYINLNGKVLKYEHPKLKTYLGWSKEMILNIIESTKKDDIQIHQIDNICDESSYEITKAKTTVTDKNQLQKKNNLNEYIKYNEVLLKTNQNYKDIFGKITRFINEMKNNYMFMKGFEDSYIQIFNEKKKKLIKEFLEVLRGPNDNYRTSYNIISELLDSLIFSDLYKFIFKDCLVNFYGEEEKKIKQFLEKNPSKYDWDDLETNEIYHKCKFQSAIQYLKNISSKKTIFEKMAVINEVNNLITAETKNIYESQGKKNFILNGKDLVDFWIYIIAHCDTENILAEAQFLNLFGIIWYQNTYYLANNFFDAAKRIKDEILKNDNILSQYIEPNQITL